ncbi:MAG: GAF domain-containing protein, partial [Myxococcales bacterium]|nr:GAF domain-containing protein [Myxococcales bacterium]
MATRSVRIERAERPRTAAQLDPLIEGVLVAPALISLLTGAYSNGLPSLPALLSLLISASALIKRGLSERETEPLWAASITGLAMSVPLICIAELAGHRLDPLFPLVAVSVFLSGHFNSIRSGVIVAVMAGFICLLVSGPSDILVRRSEWLLFSACVPVLFVARRRKNRLSTNRGVTKQVAAVPSASRPAVMPDTVIAANVLAESSLVDIALRVAERSISAANLSLLLLEGDNSILRVVCSTDHSLLGVTTDAQFGVFGGAIRTGNGVLANHIGRSFPEDFQGDMEEQAKHVLCSPVKRGRVLAGVLLAQRTTEVGFEPESLAIVAEASELLSQSLLAQRQIERVTDAHHELERFFEASRMLNSALTPEEVFSSCNQALEMIGDFDLSAITWSAGGSDDYTQSVVYLSGDHAPAAGFQIDPEKSLSAMVVKNGHYLPLGGEYRRESAPIFHKAEKLGALRSVVVLPLRLHDQIRGTLVVGTTTPDEFTDQ